MLISHSRVAGFCYRFQGLMLMSPTLTPEQARAYYDRNAHRQDAQGWYADAALERLVALGDFGNASEVLELGCGTGRLAQRLLRDHLATHARYTGIDISPSMLARAGTRLKKYATRATLIAQALRNGFVAGNVKAPLQGVGFRGCQCLGHSLISDGGNKPRAGARLNRQTSNLSLLKSAAPMHAF